MLICIQLGLLFTNVYQLLLLLYLPICDLTYSYLLCQLLYFTYFKKPIIYRYICKNRCISCQLFYSLAIYQTYY
jgi:hypothetical protein